MNKIKTESQSVTGSQNDDEIDLMSLLLTILRGWKTILVFAFVSLLLGVVYSRYVQPTYRTDALIQIEDTSGGVSGLGADISELVGTEASPAEAERELIKSRMVLTPVIDNLNLDIVISDPAIDILQRIQVSNLPTQVNTSDNVTLETADGIAVINEFEVSPSLQNATFTLQSTDAGFLLSYERTDKIFEFSGNIGEPVTITTDEGDIDLHIASLPVNHPIFITDRSLKVTVDSINSILFVSEKGKSTGIIQLSMTGNNQTQISNILKQIIISYVTQNQSRGSERTTTTIEFMETQIPLLKQKLEASEELFNQFRQEYGTLDVTQEAQILLTENAQTEARLGELQLKKAELLTYYTEDHPLVVQINDQLEVLNSRINEIDLSVNRLPEVQRQFIKLSEDMGINREIYLTMLKNYEQLKIARAGEIGYVRVIDMPISASKPIAPKKLQIIVLALLLGTMLGMLLVLLKNLLRNTVRDPDRLEMATGVPVIATIPLSPALRSLTKSRKSKGNFLLASVEHDGLSYEAIRSLRTSLMLSMPKFGKAATIAGVDSSKADKLGKVILITGEAPNVGKSFISSNLAESFGQLNKKVLLIDADLRRGQLHADFNIPVGAGGLGDYLLDNSKDIRPFIHPTVFDFIDFLPRGEHPHNPASLLAGQKFGNMITKLVAVYDYIIVDTPPILAVSDAILMAQYADKVIMACIYNDSLEGQVVHAVNKLHKSNVNIDGIVLNGMKQGFTDKNSYHYNYAYTQDKS